MTLLIGIPACTKFVVDEPNYSTPARYIPALMGMADAVPVLLPPVGERMLAVLDRLDGLLVNGSPSNVHPSRYGDGRLAHAGRPRPGARRHHAAADPRRRGARPADAVHLPRPPGAERGVRRQRSTSRCTPWPGAPTTAAARARSTSSSA